MKTVKIIITVRGGNVQAVHASPALPAAELIVLDYDNAQAGEPFGEEQKIAEGEMANKQVIEIY